MIHLGLMPCRDKKLDPYICNGTCLLIDVYPILDSPENRHSYSQKEGRIQDKIRSLLLMNVLSFAITSCSNSLMLFVLSFTLSTICFTYLQSYAAWNNTFLLRYFYLHHLWKFLPFCCSSNASQTLSKEKKSPSLSANSQNFIFSNSYF